FLRGAKANTIWIVEQLGLAIILSSILRSLALISGTTSFLVGSILQAEELSTTMVPASANFGAHSKEVPPPAEKIAISGFSETACAKPITVYVLSLNLISLPADLSLATNNNSSN